MMERKTVPALPLLASCQPNELAEWLLQNRFGGTDQQGLTNFLLEAIASLPQAQAISDEMTEEQEASDPPTTLGEDLLQSPSVDLTFVAPRGKFQVSWKTEGLQCTDKKGEDFVIPASALAHMVLFPKPEDCQPSKRTTTDLALLVFQSQGSSNSTPPAVTYKGKPLKQVCFSLPLEMPAWRERAEEDDESDDDEGMNHTDQWTRVLCKALSWETAKVVRATNPAAAQDSSNFWRYQFESFEDESTSTTTGGLPFVKCYRGVQDGVLYPLAEGLLFFKPPLFLPRQCLHSIAVGRGGGGASGTGSRYVDVTVVHTDDKDEQKTMEFSNIHRNEMSVLQAYIQKTLIPAMKKDLNEPEDVTETQEPVVEEDETVDDGDAVVRRRGNRKASAEARAATRMQMQAEPDVDDEDDDDVEYTAVVAQDVEETDDEDDDPDTEDDERPASREASAKARAATRMDMEAVPVDDPDDDEDDDVDFKAGAQDGEETEQDDEEEDVETESEEEEEPAKPRKKARNS